MPITETFAALRARREVGLIPYITAGDPDLEVTFEIAQELVRQGADIIELGVPFSDQFLGNLESVARYLGEAHEVTGTKVERA